jgi:hypothetical protein
MLIKLYLFNFNFGLLKLLSHTKKGIKHQNICLQLLKVHLINFIKKNNRKSDIALINWVSYRLQILFWFPDNQNKCAKHSKWATSLWRNRKYNLYLHEKPRLQIICWTNVTISSSPNLTVFARIVTDIFIQI